MLSDENMRVLVFLALISLLAGCCNTILCYDGPDVSKVGAGKYEISVNVIDRVVKKDVRALSSFDLDLAGIHNGLGVSQNPQPISDARLKGWTWHCGDKDVPVQIEVTRDLGEGQGGLAHLNNFFSLCTLLIWPCYSSQNYKYNVVFRNGLGEKDCQYVLSERSLTSSFILGWIPIPGWADKRSFDFDKTVFSEFEKGTFNKIVCANLTKEDYDAVRSKYDAALNDAELYEIAANNSISPEIRYDRASLLKDESLKAKILMRAESSDSELFVESMCRKINSQETLHALAKSAKSEKVRYYASHQLTNDQYLADVLLDAVSAKMVDGLCERVASDELLTKIAINAPLSTIRKEAAARVKIEANMADIVVSTDDKEIGLMLTKKIADNCVRQRVARDARLKDVKYELAEFLDDVTPVENLVANLNDVAQSNVCVKTKNVTILKRFALGEFSQSLQEIAIRRIGDADTLYEIYFSEKTSPACKKLAYGVASQECKKQIDVKKAEIIRIAKEKAAAEREKKIQQIIAKKRREKAERIAAERREERLRTPEYQTLKKWYDGQLEYNDLVEVMFQQPTDEVFSLSFGGPSGSFSINYIRDQGLLQYPSSMTKGFAERLIKTRIRMEEIEEGN